MTARPLGALFAMQGIAFGLLMPFPVPLLDERGVSAAGIGLIMSIAGLVSLLAYPVWGAIADGWLGRPLTIVLTAAVAALGGLAIILAGSDPLLLTLAFSLALAGALSWGPLIDALTLGELADGSAGYGRIRVWASAGWAASAMAGGALWVVAGSSPVFVAFVTWSVLLGGYVAWLFGRRSGGPRAGRAASAAAHGADSPGPARARRQRRPRRPSFRGWLPQLLTPVLLAFLVGLFVTSLGEHASWRFISLRILDQGGGVFLVGLAAALPAIVEMPFFASSRRLVVSLGLRGVFVGGALLAAVLLALVAAAPEPWMLTALRTLEGSAYALRYVAMVLIVGVLVARHLYAMGQSLAWLVYAGIAPIVADAGGGLIYEAFGAPVLFLTATATLALGGGIVWVVLRDPAFGRHAPVAPAPEPPPAPPPPA